MHATTCQLVKCLHATQADNTPHRTHTMITRSKAQQNQPSSKDNKGTTAGKKSISGKNKEQNPADCKKKLTQAKQMFNRCRWIQKKIEKEQKGIQQLQQTLENLSDDK